MVLSIGEQLLLRKLCRIDKNFSKTKTIPKEVSYGVVYWGTTTTEEAL